MRPCLSHCCDHGEARGSSSLPDIRESGKYGDASRVSPVWMVCGRSERVRGVQAGGVQTEDGNLMATRVGNDHEIMDFVDGDASRGGEGLPNRKQRNFSRTVKSTTFEVTTALLANPAQSGRSGEQSRRECNVQFLAAVQRDRCARAW